MQLTFGDAVEKRGQVLSYPHFLRHQRHLLMHCVGQCAQAF